MPARVSVGVCLFLAVLCLGDASPEAAEPVKSIPLVNRKNDIRGDVEISREGGRMKAVPFVEISPDSPLLRKLRDAAARRHHGHMEERGSLPASGSEESPGGIEPAREEIPQDGR